MENIILILVIFVILGAAVLNLRREKKRGKACVGCPYGGCCGKNGCCGEK